MSGKNSSNGGGTTNSSREGSKTPVGSKPGSSKVGAEGTGAKAKPMSNREKAVAKVVSLEDAERILSEAGWSTIGQNWTAGAVSQLILQLTNLVDIKEAPLVKALAIVVMVMAEDDMSATIAKAVLSEMAETMGQFKAQQAKNEEKVEGMEQFASNVANCAGHLQAEMVDLQVQVSETAITWKDAGEAMKTAADEVRKTAEGLHQANGVREAEAAKEAERRKLGHEETAKRVEESAKRIEEAAAKAEELRREAAEESAKRIEAAARAATSQTGKEGGAGGATTNSYAGVVKATPSAKLAMERTEERNRKVLFIRMGNRELVERHEPEELMFKAKRALELVKDNGTEVPEWVVFMGAKTLEKGDVVYDMRTKEAAAWLKANKVAFLVGFGARLGIKEEEYALIVENIPVGFNPCTEALEGTEVLNGIDAGSITSFKWIKPTNQRRHGQRSAFATVKVSSAQAANSLIRKGLYAGGRSNKARKVVSEVQRCFKCQRLNPRHIASTCPCAKEVCEWCGGDHRSGSCEIRGNDPAEHWCVNCKVHGHGAGDRLCDMWQRAARSANVRAPENMFKYFLLEGDEETLERLYEDENGEYGGGNSYTKTLAEGWTDVRQGQTKDYSNGATGGGAATKSMGEPAWGAQPRIPGGFGGRKKKTVDDEAAEIEEQTLKRKERDAQKTRAEKAKAREDARVEARVAEQMAATDFGERLALATAGVRRAEEASAAAKAGLAPGEVAVEGNTWGAVLDEEGESQGWGASGEEELITEGDKTEANNIQTPTPEATGRQGHEAI